MAPTKRARPAFSPPRPRKATKSSTSTSSATKPKSRSTSSKSKPTSRPSTTPKPKSKPKPPARQRSRLVSPTPSASDSLDSPSTHSSPSTRPVEDSPEPDYILAEVTHGSPSSDPPVPLGLVHRILHSHFSHPDTTKISTDARELVAKYLEVFVREAIMRCAYERGDGEEKEGWLEVEDLEKVAVQLCLDF